MSKSYLITVYRAARKLDIKVRTFTEQEKSKPLIERMGATMSHAGVAITITSITNFIAFGIGATSSLPALRSFCVYASIGILTIFCFQVGIILPRDVCQAFLTSSVLQVTWFVALLTLDERRVERGRNGCCCCILQRPRDQPECEEREEEKPGFMSRSTYKSLTHAECCFNAECSPGSLTG